MNSEEQWEIIGYCPGCDATVWAMDGKYRCTDCSCNNIKTEEKNHDRDTEGI